MSTIAENIEASLREDREEAREHGDIVASADAIQACQEIVRCIGKWLKPPLQWVVFGEGDGGVDFVLRHFRLDRRVDFRIASDGRRIRTVAIDDCMVPMRNSFPLLDGHEMVALALWVSGKTDELPWYRIEG